MIIKTIPAGIYDANCYIIGDEETKEAVVLDPGGDGEMLENEIIKLGYKVKYILLTHGHFDHVGGVEYLTQKFDIPYYITKVDEDFMKEDSSVFGTLSGSDHYLKEGDRIKFGKKEISVIETPGHTKGGVCFFIEDKLFSGDTLFQGSIGRTDFLGGDFEEIINSIKNKLLPLGDEVEVYPGHGPMSTIGYEKRRNPYVS